MNYSSIDPEFNLACSLIEGPVIVTGACGFVGSVLFRKLLDAGVEAYGVIHGGSKKWRLEGLPPERFITADLTDDRSIKQIISIKNWSLWFHLAAYGAYQHQDDIESIYVTNLIATAKIIDNLIQKKSLKGFIQAGSSSEYGYISDAPSENVTPEPNSHYALSKLATAQLIKYQAKKNGFPGVNLRLYSVYGPYEEASRLMPTLISNALVGRHPPYAKPSITRDFVYIDDVCLAFVKTALKATEYKGHTFNIGTGTSTTLQDLANLITNMFQLQTKPCFGEYPDKIWEVDNWRCNPRKAKKELNWVSNVSLADGIKKYSMWMSDFP
jgi:dolichol-phosphate mannosyltransferase